MDCLAFQADLVEPAVHGDAQLTDPFDQAILGTLVAAEADHLITGDKALLALAEKYPVLSAAQFWQIHGAAREKAMQQMVGWVQGCACRNAITKDLTLMILS